MAFLNTILCRGEKRKVENFLYIRGVIHMNCAYILVLEIIKLIGVLFNEASTLNGMHQIDEQHEKIRTCYNIR